MGGGGTATQQNVSQYAPEFRPIASGAAEKILQMQQLNPITNYVYPHQQGTAGFSPWQQIASQAIPQMAITPEAITQLGNIVTPISSAASAVANMGDVTPAAQGALVNLSKYGALPGMSPAGGQHVGFSPGRQNMFSYGTTQLAPYMPKSPAPQQSVFPGLSFGPEQIQQLLTYASQTPISVLYGTPTGSTTNQGAYWTPALPTLPPGTPPPSINPYVPPPVTAPPPPENGA